MSRPLILSAAVALLSSGVVGAADQRKCVSYDYEEAGKSVRLTMPEGLAVVRGILVVGPWSGGDSRDLHREAWYREFMHLHDFAFLGADWPGGTHAENYKAMRNALKTFATSSKHPELIYVPYVATGFSAGGGFASRLVVEDPDKVIAAVIVGSRLKLADTTDAHRGVPVCIINGEHEHGDGEAGGMAVVVEPVLKDHRPKGALWGWMAVPDIGHTRDAQEVLAMPILDAAVRLRYPNGDVRKGPVKLKPVDPESGWVADNTTWHSGLTTVTPAKSFKSIIAKSSWLLNEDIAFIYRAYATYDRPLKVVSPGYSSARSQVLDAGASVRITVDDSRFAGWKKIELYDGAAKVGELSKGPVEFTVKDLKAGYHAFSGLGTDDKGAVRTSAPVLVVVRKP